MNRCDNIIVVTNVPTATVLEMRSRENKIRQSPTYRSARPAFIKS